MLKFDSMVSQSLSLTRSEGSASIRFYYMPKVKYKSIASQWLNATLLEAST